MAVARHRGLNGLPRRRFLQLMGGAGIGGSLLHARAAYAGLMLPREGRALPYHPSAGYSGSTAAKDPGGQAASYAFEEVPASATGITWVHSNGRSPEMYLPETTGAGCGFLDFDNDGWMDIYLVNSGRCDFFNPNPPLRNALYRNNRDGTFTDVTVKAGVPKTYPSVTGAQAAAPRRYWNDLDTPAWQH